VAVDDEALGSMLEALATVGGASEMLPSAPNVAPGERLAVAEELLRRGWIDAAAAARGDGRLFAIREIRLTPQGQVALKDLRATLGRTRPADHRTTPLEEKRRRRLLFMRRLYESTNGSRLAGINMWSLGSELGWDRAEVDNVIEYLEGEGLVEYIGMGGEIAITHAGVVEVEQSLSNPEEETLHFPAAVNIINVENMYGSQIQQGTTGSAQEGHFLSDVAADSLRAALAALRADLGDVVLDAEDRSELEAEIGTAEQQLGSSRPKLATIRGSAQRVTQLLTRATVVTGSAVQLAAHVERLHELLPGI
jgi:hypothetical protein